MTKRKWSVRSFVLRQLLWLAGLWYGLLVLALSLVIVRLRRKELEPTESEVRLRSSTSRQLWSLEDGLDNPLSHGFVTLHTGARLHYLSTKRSPSTAPKLIVFLHGFPDSCYLWEHQLRSIEDPSVKAVSLDLPGCGGSDGLDGYSAELVLNAVSEAILLLRQRYLRPSREIDGQCILVSHDWGGVISLRLAAETDGLFDQLIAMNACHPAHFERNIRGRVDRTRQFIRAWRKSPLTITPLIQAFEECRPVVSQHWKLGYTFMFRLPLPLAWLMPNLAGSLIRLCHLLSHGVPSKPSSQELAVRWSASCGPSTAETRTTTFDHQSYGRSVSRRATANPRGDWDQRIRLYKENLVSGPWRPSATVAAYAAAPPPPPRSPPTMTTIAAAAAAAGKPKPHTAKFNCPVKIIFGMRDVALDPRICVDGIDDYFQGGAATSKNDVLKLPTVGHWSPLEREGQDVLTALLREAVK